MRPSSFLSLNKARSIVRCCGSALRIRSKKAIWRCLRLLSLFCGVELRRSEAPEVGGAGGEATLLLNPIHRAQQKRKIAEHENGCIVLNDFKTVLRERPRSLMLPLVLPFALIARFPVIPCRFASSMVVFATRCATAFALSRVSLPVSFTCSISWSDFSPIRIARMVARKCHPVSLLKADSQFKASLLRPLDQSPPGLCYR
jgi:hypothetical protein